MSMREITSGDDVEEFDYISTHPSNQKRSLNLEQMIPDVSLYCVLDTNTSF